LLYPRAKRKTARPATEWHLEKAEGNEYLLYSMNITKPYRCDLAELQPGQPGGADWSVENPFEPGFSMRLKNEGEGSITDPSFKTAGGTVKFRCTVAENQYLLFDFDGTATLTDRNYTTLQTVEVLGGAALPTGTSAVAFSCGHAKYETPEITVRFMTRGVPETIIGPADGEE
jgi:hypothetical protein